MQLSIFYFSGSGNTKWAVEQFSKSLENSGYKLSIYSIDKNINISDEFLKSVIAESDYIGFANPIYGANIPPIMNKFIHRLAEILSENETKKPIFYINTIGYINAFGPIEAKKIFKVSCFELKWYVNLKICNNISTPKIKSNLISEELLEKRKAKAKKNLENFAQKIIKGKKYIGGIGPYLLPGIFIRKKSAESIRNFYKTLGVNNEICKKCMLCIKNCPTESIILNGDDFKFSENCTACVRCYNFCPSFAITIEGKFADPTIYERYRGPEKGMKINYFN